MEQGYEDAEEILGVKDLYDPREQWASYVLNAIKAKELFLRDVNYIIRGKEVLIVDEFTGRVMQVNLHLCSVYHKENFDTTIYFAYN
jgi:preprotein translocase subunit SecA